MTITTTVSAGARSAGPDVADLVSRTQDLVREVVLPVEDAFDGDVTAAGGDDLRRELQAAARERGLLAPHAPVELGGAGLSMAQRARVFEAAGRSVFGGLAINAAAPDEGNVHLLAHVATAAQREEFLAPLVAGDVRSAFAMTEPAPGAGSDPAALATTASVEVHAPLRAEVIVHVRPRGPGRLGDVRSRHVGVRSRGEQPLRRLQDLLATVVRGEAHA